MQKKYISFDVEASGPTPGKYSMLSLGACIVGDTSVQFYREIKPISKNFVLEAMRVGALGLRCLDDLKGQEEYDPKSKNFNPAKVLELLQEKGDAPEKVMAEYANWIKTNTAGFKPVEAAAPIKFALTQTLKKETIQRRKALHARIRVIHCHHFLVVGLE